MNTTTAAPSCPDDDPFDLDLFCLELEHQVETRIKPALKDALDRRQARFQAEFDRRPQSVCERQRWKEARAEYERRLRRRRYVESGEAAKNAVCSKHPRRTFTRNRKGSPATRQKTSKCAVRRAVPPRAHVGRGHGSVVRDLAARLAHAWSVPLILDPRLNGMRTSSA